MGMIPWNNLDPVYHFLIHKTGITTTTITVIVVVVVVEMVVGSHYYLHQAMQC